MMELLHEYPMYTQDGNGIMGKRVPNPYEMMDKINELIDTVNRLENEIKQLKEEKV